MGARAAEVPRELAVGVPLAARQDLEKLRRSRRNCQSCRILNRCGAGLVHTLQELAHHEVCREEGFLGAFGATTLTYRRSRSLDGGSCIIFILHLFFGLRADSLIPFSLRAIR